VILTGVHLYDAFNQTANKKRTWCRDKICAPSVTNFSWKLVRK